LAVGAAQGRCRPDAGDPDSCPLTHRQFSEGACFNSTQPPQASRHAPCGAPWASTVARASRVSKGQPAATGDAAAPAVVGWLTCSCRPPGFASGAVSARATAVQGGT